MEVYVIMCLNDIVINEYYTDEKLIAKIVEGLIEATGDGFWYKTLHQYEI